MQTILGAGGVIGYELAKFLPEYTDRVRLVSRHPGSAGAGQETMRADLTNLRQTREAVAGSQVVYLTAGLPYKASVWQKTWPLIMKNVITACAEEGAGLVFFDNIYMYGRVSGWMTEETPHRPVSRKGKVRAEIAEMLLEAAAVGKVKALIARSADFYGPGAVNTAVHSMVFGNLQEGRKAVWMINPELRHSMTYTPDAGRATALLGNTEEAFGEIWHLPTDMNPPTGREFIEAVAKIYEVEARITVLSKGMIRFAGLFNPIARESMEMLYQLEDEYLFDSSRFSERFFPATPYAEGILTTAQSR